MEIKSGIHLIEHVRGANSYLISTSDGVAIIDTGMPGNEKRIVEYIRSVGIEPAKPVFIILTHPDIDHSGSAARLKGLTGAKIAIHEQDAPRLSGEKKLKEVKGGIGIVFSLMKPFVRFTPTKPDVVLKDSDHLLDLVVIHTPGHTDGSISLYRENEAMFVGDAVRTDSQGRPHLPPSSMTVNMEQAKESVKKIAGYQYSTLLPGHGPPMTRDASRIVADYVQSGFATE